MIKKLFNFIYINYIIKYNFKFTYKLYSIIYSKNDIETNDELRKSILIILYNYYYKSLSYPIKIFNNKLNIFNNNINNECNIDNINNIQYLLNLSKLINLDNNFTILFKNYLINKDIIVSLLVNLSSYTKYDNIINNNTNKHLFDNIILINNNILIDIINKKIIMYNDNFMYINDIEIESTKNNTIITFKNYIINLKIMIDKYKIDTTILIKNNPIFILNKYLKVELLNNSKKFIIYNNVDNSQIILNLENKIDFIDQNFLNKNIYDKFKSYIYDKYSDLYKLFIDHNHDNVYINNNTFDKVIFEFKEHLEWLDKKNDSHNHDALYIKKEDYTNFYILLTNKIDNLQKKIKNIDNNKDLTEKFDKNFNEILKDISKINDIINNEKDKKYLQSYIFDELYYKLKDKVNSFEEEFINHNHKDLYYNKDEINKIIVDLKEFSFKSNINYYTKNEINLALKNKSNINHNHDNTYIKIEEQSKFVYKETLNNIINNKSDINHNHDEEYLSIKEKNNIIFFLCNKINILEKKLKFSNNFETKVIGYEDNKINDLSKNLLDLLLNFKYIDEYFKKLSNDEIPDYYNKTNIIYNNMLTFDKIFNLLFHIINKLDLKENNSNDYELLELKNKWKNNNYFINYKNN
jgi:hypothetical protein